MRRVSRLRHPTRALARTKSGLPADQDRGNFDGAVRQQPPKKKWRLPGMDVIEGHGAEDHAVIKQHDDGADSPCDSERHGEERDLSVVGHEHGGEGALVPGKPVVLGGLFPARRVPMGFRSSLETA